MQTKDPADVNNYRTIAIATGLFHVLNWACLAVATRQVPVDWDSQFRYTEAHGTEITMF